MNEPCRYLGVEHFRESGKYKYLEVNLFDLFQGDRREAGLAGAVSKEEDQLSQRDYQIECGFVG